jgi:hypothetical protein
MVTTSLGRHTASRTIGQIWNCSSRPNDLAPTENESQGQFPPNAIKRSHRAPSQNADVVRGPRRARLDTRAALHSPANPAYRVGLCHTNRSHQVWLARGGYRECLNAISTEVIVGPEMVRQPGQRDHGIVLAAVEGAGRAQGGVLRKKSTAAIITPAMKIVAR